MKDNNLNEHISTVKPAEIDLTSERGIFYGIPMS
jgi:hypothetical protein